MKPFGRDSFVPAPALLCLDLQREQMVTPGLDAATAARCIGLSKRVLSHARASGWQVAHVHRCDAGLGLAEHSRSIEGLEPHAREPVFHRDRASAFASSAFGDYVARLGDPRLILIGFSLPTSVLFTAIACSELSVPVTVVQGAAAASATRRASGEATEAALLGVLAGFAEVVTVEQLLLETGSMLTHAANHP